MDEPLQRCILIDDVQYCMYRDSDYNQREYMEILFQGTHISPTQIAFNKSMEAIRVIIAWIFKEIKPYSSVLDYKRKLRICESLIAALYITGISLSNIRNYIYPNQISQYFTVRPPRLEQYLSSRD